MDKGVECRCCVVEVEVSHEFCSSEETVMGLEVYLPKQAADKEYIFLNCSNCCKLFEASYAPRSDYETLAEAAIR